MTDIWYDTEFLEDGQTIELISIGMVREDGAKLYLINGEFDLGKIVAHDWLMENVFPHLPAKLGEDGMPEWDIDHKDWIRAMPRKSIRHYVRDFVLALPEPVLWADYAAYDHVVLAQLFGRMIDLPDGFPMWTCDFQQERCRLGYPVLEMDETIGVNEHHALADAEDLRWKHAKLRGIEWNRLLATGTGQR